MAVRWLEDIRAGDLESVGGKAASLGELTEAGLPVPPGFVVTADTYRSFIEETGIADELFAAVDIDTEDSAALAEAYERASALILGTDFPEDITEGILDAYDGLDDGEAFVAVRSSATAEDLPSISAEDSALIRVDGDPRFGRMADIAPIDCRRHAVEVPAMTADGVDWCAVEELYGHEADGDRLYRVTTVSGREITVSPDHSLIVLDEDRGQPVTVRIDELDGDENVPVVRRIPTDAGGVEPIDVSEYVGGADVAKTDGGLTMETESDDRSIRRPLPDAIEPDPAFAYFLGLYIAAGSTEGGTELSLTNTADGVLERALEFPTDVGLRNARAPDTHSYRFTCPWLVRFLHAVAGGSDSSAGTGRVAGGTRVPDFVFGWSDELLSSFLRGCLDGDGSVGEDGISYTSTSADLVDGLVRLLEMLGFRYTVRKREHEGSRSGSVGVKIPASEAERFRATVGFESGEKRERLERLIDRQGENGERVALRNTVAGSEPNPDRTPTEFELASDGSISWEPIERIEEVDSPGMVYDFCVPDVENFAAGFGSVITHNTASFAGQQETFLNVDRDDLLDRVKECWASLFTQRAIYYRNEQGFDHDAVDIAVVVQRMVDAGKSGVLFTSHPSTGEPVMIVEAAWGLGEAVVSGTVSPDNYVLDRRSGEVRDATIADKKVLFERDHETGETVEREVSDDRREARVLDEDELDRLTELGERVEDHYGTPQDVEWAIADGEVYMLQSRPITTIDRSGGIEEESAGATNGGAATDSPEVILEGLGASPGIASGPVRIVETLDELDKVGTGDIIATAMTTPDMVPAMKRAAGIVTREGGMTSHAAIVSRELGVPAVVGIGDATSRLDDGQVVTIDGDRGLVQEGRAEEDEREPVEEVRPKSPVKPMTATEVKVNVSIPEAAERAAATGADGVGLLRLEHLILSTNETPEHYIETHGERAYVDEIVGGVRTVADEFYPRPVRVRTLDAPTDEFRRLEGGEDEPAEHNPMLGYRGIRRSLDRPAVFEHELEAFSRLFEMGYDNIEIMFPLVNDADEVIEARSLMEAAGIDPARHTWGVMIETPASALGIEHLLETGIDFASFGTNDLTQYTLAVDRNNEHVAHLYDEMHPAVLELISRTIRRCREHDVKTSICGQAGSRPAMVRFLVNEGVSSISANIDAVRDVQHEVKRVEQRLILESIREDP